MVRKFASLLVRRVETITNQILQGVGAEIAILSIERDAERLSRRFVTSRLASVSESGNCNKTPFVILVARHPRGIRDFPDLAKPGVN